MGGIIMARELESIAILPKTHNKKQVKARLRNLHLSNEDDGITKSLVNAVYNYRKDCDNLFHVISDKRYTHLSTVLDVIDSKRNNDIGAIELIDNILKVIEEIRGGESKNNRNRSYLFAHLGVFQDFALRLCITNQNIKLAIDSQKINDTNHELEDKIKHQEDLINQYINLSQQASMKIKFLEQEKARLEEKLRHGEMVATKLQQELEVSYSRPKIPTF
jgi:hypothetical protein